jgi:hypothetical protein
MKKLGFGIAILVLVIASVVFYLNNVEQKQMIALNKLQEKVTLQLDLMQKNGFSITQREIQKEKEHFFIAIVEPVKASAYLSQIGLRMTPMEAEELKDMKLSVELQYLSDTYSLDIYPVELPPYLTSTFIKENDKKLLAQLEEMVKQKAFFMHVDIDHSATAFNGHIKDIDETLQGEKELKLQLEGAHFSGNIKEEKIVAFEQSLQSVILHVGEEADITISDLQSKYAHVGPTIYDYTSEYSIGGIESSETPEGKLIANSLSIFSASTVNNGLATEKIRADIEHIDVLYGKEKMVMHTFVLDMNTSNLDVEALEKLQKIDPAQVKEVDALIETLVSKNIHIEIPHLSVERITLREQEMSGFTLHANLDIDQSFNIYSAEMKPKYALKKINGDIYLSMSKELLDVIKEDPKAMITYMMYRPKRKLGQRIYDIKIGNGELKLNGKPVKF